MVILQHMLIYDLRRASGPSAGGVTVTDISLVNIGHPILVFPASVGNQLIEPGAVKCRIRNAVIAACSIEIPALLMGMAAQHFTPVFNGDRLPSSFAVTAERAIDSHIVTFLHLGFFDLLGRKHIASIT